MGYALEALVGPADLIMRLAAENPPGVAVPLAQNLAMIPVTGDVFDAWAGPGTGSPLGFYLLPGDRLLAGWSRGRRLSYVEADFFGGAGGQNAIVWFDGEVVLGPLIMAAGDPMPAEGSPISQALRKLGVERGGHFDEFDAAGLGRHRHTDAWLP